jgi:hypothetical protein
VDQLAKFEFKRDSEGRLSLSEAIGQAIGFGSLCWDPKPEGVFDSVLAGTAVGALQYYVEQTTVPVEENDEFINKIMENIPDSWDGEESGEWIVVEYVREIERRLLARGGTLERWEGNDEG